MLHERQRRVRLPALFRDFPVMVGLTFVLSSPRPHQVCIRKGRYGLANLSFFTAVRDIGFEARSSQEKNLTIKDIYGQEVVDAFFKTEATCAVVLLSQSSQLLVDSQGDVMSQQIAVIQETKHRVLCPQSDEAAD